MRESTPAQQAAHAERLARRNRYETIAPPAVPLKVRLFFVGLMLAAVAVGLAIVVGIAYLVTHIGRPDDPYGYSHYSCAELSADRQERINAAAMSDPYNHDGMPAEAQNSLEWSSYRNCPKNG